MIRVMLDLSPEFYKKLKELQKQLGAVSKAETIRRAIDFHLFKIKELNKK